MNSKASKQSEKKALEPHSSQTLMATKQRVTSIDPPTPGTCILHIIGLNFLPPVADKLGCFVCFFSHIPEPSRFELTLGIQTPDLIPSSLQ
jgi:hypothetical protein